MSVRHGSETPVSAPMRLFGRSVRSEGGYLAFCLRVCVELADSRIVLRLRQYLFDRSLWLDECLLALNILRRSPAQLLRTLDIYQVAPYGFLLLEKMAVRYLGTGEMALRLFPFLFGVGSIFLFVAVARRFVELPAVPIGVGLFSLCGPLIYYSSEVKQYSGDVAVALLLYLLAGSLIRGRVGTMWLILVSVLGLRQCGFQTPRFSFWRVWR